MEGVRAAKLLSDGTPVVGTAGQAQPCPSKGCAVDRIDAGSDVREGLRDHIGGGFFFVTPLIPAGRYPTTKKMLYTQALLSRLYFKAAES